jgi:hypothetical protein
MPYVRRNPEGRIDSLHREASVDQDEFADDSHPEVLEFLGRDGSEGFSRLDADFVRVIEDLVDVLVSKNILNITDLPVEAQAKLFARKGYRDRISSNSLQLFGKDVSGDNVI